MSKEERYTYHCDQYDYVEIIYDNEECEEIDSMKMAEKRLNRQQDKISDLEAKLAEKEDRINWLVEAEFNRKWAKKYVEMRRKEDPMLCLPDSDEVYEKYFELKQQLATQENTITNLVEDNRASQEWYKKQLAEKEKEYNIKYKHWIEEIRESDRLREELAKTNKEWVQSIHDWKELCKKKDQDKISFAVEQLEKVKEFCNQREKDFTYLKDEVKCIDHNKWVDYIEELRFIKSHIDNQIKQLKEQ